MKPYCSLSWLNSLVHRRQREVQDEERQVEGMVVIRPSKILIVDDEPFNVDYLTQELEGMCSNFWVGTWRAPLGCRLRGQGVELFGDCEALFDPLFQLLFSQHVHQFDANKRGLRRLKPFEL
jgi:hypothetical protein